MNKLSSILLAGAAVAAAACTDTGSRSNALNLAPGTYERTSSSTDAGGTTTTNKEYTDVTVDNYGHKQAVVQSKTIQDPPGLFNKRTTNETEAVEERN